MNPPSAARLGINIVMECRHVQSKLTAYVDGDLHPAERDSTAAHLAQCPACREELAEVRRLLSDCREFLVCPGPAYSFETLRRRMAQVQSLDEVAAFLPRLRIHHTAPRFAVAMLFLVLLLGTSLPLRHARMVIQAAKSPFKERFAQCQPEYIEQMDTEYRAQFSPSTERDDSQHA